MILTVTLNAAIDKRYVVDDCRMGEVNRVKECTYVPGGKGLNVSKPASIYGAEVVATGFVGGHAGNYIEEALKPFGIKSAFYHVEGGKPLLYQYLGRSQPCADRIPGAGIYPHRRRLPGI